MKSVNRVLIFGFLLVAGFAVSAQKVEWLTFEEAVAKSQNEPKKLLIDIYTDWCGWCKKMDKEAYSHPELVSYIHENYYPVKFNAEQKEPVEFAGHTFEFVAQGRRGVHELAAALTNNKLSYPTTVFMDEDFRIIQSLPGYRDARGMDPILKYFGDDIFKNKSWKEFEADYRSSL